MTWPFEHWNEGKVYLHNDKWKEFKNEIDKFGYKEEKHDWQHNRIFCKLHTPRDVIINLPCPGDENLKHKIETTAHWTMIYEPFPAFERTRLDPEGWLPSWNLYAEDNRTGEELTILTTGEIFERSEDSIFTLYSTRYTRRNVFAYFKGKYWIVSDYENFGIGSAPPPKKVKSKKVMARSIFDPFEESW